MILTGVIHYKVKADTYPFIMTLVCQLGQILHISEFRFYRTEVRHGIAAVTSALRTF